MEGTGGSEPTGQMLSRRLAESAGSHSRIDERSVAEEAELLECLHRESLTVEIPNSLPDFIGSEHEVWSDGETVTKATLPGSYGRLWGERRFALPSEYLRRIDLSNTIFAIRWEVVGLTLELNRVRIVSQQPFFKGEAPTLSEIAEFMRSCDFECHEHRFGTYWKHQELNVVAFDAEPGNFVKTPIGLVPVDLILQKELTADETPQLHHPPESTTADPAI